MNLFLDFTREIRCVSWPVPLPKTNSLVPVCGIDRLSPRSLKAMCVSSHPLTYFSSHEVLSVFPTSKLEFYFPCLTCFSSVYAISSIQNDFFHSLMSSPYTYLLCPLPRKVNISVFAFYQISSPSLPTST